MLKEHRVMNEIRLWCGEHNLLCFRCNVGKVLTADGTYFDTGLPKGFSDLIILDNDGHIYFVECKSSTGKQRADQVKFQQIVEARHFTYILARSVDDIINIIS